MKRVLCMLFFLAVTAVPQGLPGIVQKMITLKYAEPQAVAKLVQIYGVSIQIDQRMKVIAIGGPKEQVAQAEAAIQQLDVPAAAPKDIELTAYFVTASNNAQINSGNPIPQDLQGVVDTLKKTFPFQSYLLMDALSLHAASGTGAGTTGQLANRQTSSFRVRTAAVDTDGNIRLDFLQANVRIPQGTDREGKMSYGEAGLSTDLLNVKDGQKLVVGRTSLQGPDKALFLILIAHVAR